MKGHILAITIIILVSTDILFDQLMVDLGLSRGELALQKCIDSCIIPIMKHKYILDIHSHIGKNLFADELINNIYNILLLMICFSLIAIHYINKKIL